MMLFTLLLVPMAAWSLDDIKQEKVNNQEENDCIECNLSRGPAVVLEKDVVPAKEMSSFLRKLPLKTFKPALNRIPSRSPAVITQ